MTKSANYRKVGVQPGVRHVGSPYDFVNDSHLTRLMTNRVGQAINDGDVVITDTGNDESVVSTTTLRLSTRTIGVAQETIQNGSNGPILVAGYARMVSTGGSNVARGWYLYTSSNPRRAWAQPTREAGAFGETLEAGADPAAFVFMLPDQAPAGAATAFGLEYVFDSGGSLLSTGAKGFVEVPFAARITAVRLVADQSTNTVVDIWRDSYANLLPTVADSICAAAKPTLSAALKAQDTTLTGWTTAVAAGDWLRFNIDSNSAATRLTLSLTMERT